MPNSQLGMDRFHFFFKRSFRYENDEEKTKNETIVFKNDRFLMEIVLKKRSLTIEKRIEKRLTTL